MGGVVVERIGPGDLVELATDVGPVPMNVGAVLVLDPTGDQARRVEAALIERLSRIPRLRQRLVTPSWGLGGPYWVRDDSFDATAHVTRAVCPGRGSHEDLLALAVEVVTRPLPRDRPLWRAVVVTGLSDGADGAECEAVVIVLHHVLTDGIGGLAVLGGLVDGATPAPMDLPQGVPDRLDLLRDTVGRRTRQLRGVPTAAAGLRHGRAELGRRSGTRAIGAVRCSLNAPTGPRRTVATVLTPLAPLRTSARASGATVNDALLVAVTGAMRAVLTSRGEHVDHLVVSVPVAARTSTTSHELGNRVGVMPVAVPLSGSAPERLRRVAAITREQKTHARGSSSALVGPAFRVLARAGVFRWVVDRQRLVNTFLTNMAGPPQHLTVAGARVTGLLPITVTAGNVGVAFAAMSYAGTLSITVIADPDVVPEVDALAAALEAELARI